jgi:aquaporin Z
LRAIFGSTVAAGTPHPDTSLFSGGQALTMEVALSWLLIGVVLETAEQARITGPNGALAVGGAIGLCGLFAGAVMNPAVGLDPALSAWTWHANWIYLVGPALGGVIAVGRAQIIHGPAKAHEARAAQGDGAAPHARLSSAMSGMPVSRRRVRWSW